MANFVISKTKTLQALLQEWFNLSIFQFLLYADTLKEALNAGHTVTDHTASRITFLTNLDEPKWDNNKNSYS